MDWVHGILQARILQGVAFPFSREFSQHRNPTGSPPLQMDSLPTERSRRLDISKNPGYARNVHDSNMKTRVHDLFKSWTFFFFSMKYYFEYSFLIKILCIVLFICF